MFILVHVGVSKSADAQILGSVTFSKAWLHILPAGPHALAMILVLGQLIGGILNIGLAGKMASSAGESAIL